MQDSTIDVTVTLPEELLRETGISRKDAGQALLRAFVLSLFRQDRLSGGKAAQLLGVHRMDFIRFLAEEKIPYLLSTPEELDAEIKVLKQWPTL